MYITDDGRAVVHFLVLLNEEDNLSVDMSRMDFVMQKLRIARNKARAFGGNEYRGKSFAGGIAFPCREAAEAAEAVLSSVLLSGYAERITQAVNLYKKSDKAEERKSRNAVKYREQADAVMQAVVDEVEDMLPGLSKKLCYGFHPEYKLRYLAISGNLIRGLPELINK